MSLFIEKIHIPHIKEVIDNQLERLGIKEAHSSLYEDILENNSRPFVAFSTEYRRFNIFKGLNLCSEPNSYDIGKDFKKMMVDGVAITNSVSVTSEWIPLKETLYTVFSKKEFFDSLKHYITELLQEKTVLSNLIQADLWQTRMKSYGDKLVLPLILYHDDFESGNQLGSHVGKHAVGAVYGENSSSVPA